jgi:hypothetical protein
MLVHPFDVRYPSNVLLAASSSDGGRLGLRNRVWQMLSMMCPQSWSSPSLSSGAATLRSTRPTGYSAPRSLHCTRKLPAPVCLIGAHKQSVFIVKGYLYIHHSLAGRLPSTVGRICLSNHRNRCRYHGILRKKAQDH